jgi:NAD(P)H dehydrogenase (quinone)
MPVGTGRHSPIAADDQGRAIAALLKNPDEHIHLLRTFDKAAGGR